MDFINKIKYPLILSIAFTSQIALADFLVNNVVANGATVRITSANGTCKAFSNGCAVPVFVGFYTNNEVSTNLGSLPACVTQADCSAGAVYGAVTAMSYCCVGSDVEYADCAMFPLGSAQPIGNSCTTNHIFWDSTNDLAGGCEGGGAPAKRVWAQPCI